MATWAMRQRYAWIAARLAAGGSFNRADIVQAFTVTTQTASATVAEYRALQPDALRYDASRKAFVRADAPPLKPANNWLLSVLYEALKRLTGSAKAVRAELAADGIQSAGFDECIAAAEGALKQGESV